MVNLMKGETGDGKNYHNVRSADSTGDNYYQKSRQLT